MSKRNMRRKRGAGRRQVVGDAIGSKLREESEGWRGEFLTFVSIIQSKSSIMAFNGWPQIPGCRSIDNLLQRLQSLFSYRNAILRPLLNWKPEPGTSVIRQYRSLVLHLFANYEVPEYLVYSHLISDLHALIRIGRGGSLQTAFSGRRLSKSQARETWKVPHDLSGDVARRWAIVSAMGCSRELASLLCRIHWLKFQLDDPFSKSVVKFFQRCDRQSDVEDLDSRQPTIADGEIGEILRFIHAIKFAPPHELLGYEADVESPLMPNLCLEGKEKGVRWMRRLMANWQHQIELPPAKHPWDCKQLRWMRSNIAQYDWDDGADQWTIEELLSSNALLHEGMAMRHCVATYARYCYQRKLTIWSVRQIRIDGDGVKSSKRMATVELNHHGRTIDQVRAKFNQRPGPAVLDCLMKWAVDQDLSWSDRALPS